MSTKSETTKQNRTNFESKSLRLIESLAFKLANNPYVSIKKTPSQFDSIVFEILKYVP